MNEQLAIMEFIKYGNFNGYNIFMEVLNLTGIICFGLYAYIGLKFYSKD